MTLYRHFPSKDDLIVAYLERTNEQLLEWMEGLVRAPPRPAGRTSRRSSKGSRSWRRAPSASGCSFVAAAGETPTDHPGHTAAAAHKRAVARI